MNFSDISGYISLHPFIASGCIFFSAVLTLMIFFFVLYFIFYAPKSIIPLHAKLTSSEYENKDCEGDIINELIQKTIKRNAELQQTHKLNRKTYLEQRKKELIILRDTKLILNKLIEEEKDDPMHSRT